VAVFGGSFNPPHVAHVLTASYVLCTSDIDLFLVVPCFVHPFAKTLASFEKRHAMCLKAFGWLPKVEVSDVERQLGGESRTLRTLQYLAEKNPDWEMRLVVGSDVLQDAPRWYGFSEIEKLAPLMVLNRAGVGGEGVSVLPEVSSTEIRDAVARGRAEDIRALVPKAVFEQILSEGLYG
jgi:nicotinate-nucleotide adenylyltransferase